MSTPIRYYSHGGGAVGQPLPVNAMRGAMRLAACDLGKSRRQAKPCSGRGAEACDACNLIGASASAPAGLGCGGTRTSNLTTPLLKNGQQFTSPGSFAARRYYLTITGQASAGIYLRGIAHNGLTAITSPDGVFYGLSPDLNLVASGAGYSVFPTVDCAVESYQNAVAVTTNIVSHYQFDSDFRWPTPPRSLQWHALFAYVDSAGTGKYGGAQSLIVSACDTADAKTPLNSVGQMEGMQFTFNTFPGGVFFAGRLTGRYGRKLTLVVRTTRAYAGNPNSAGPTPVMYNLDGAFSTRGTAMLATQLLDCGGLFNCSDPCAVEYRYEVYLPSDDIIIEMQGAPIACRVGSNPPTKHPSTATIMQASLQ